MGGASATNLDFARLSEHRHACAFFKDDDEAYQVLLPFIRDGIQQGHKAVHVVRPGQEDDHLRNLEEAGVDVAEASASGQLEVHRNTDVYLGEGGFDQDRMLDAFAQMAGGSGRFPLSRIICDMEWAIGRPSTHDDLIEFEARVNDIWQRHDDVVICAYNLSELSGEMMIDIMRTHPMVLIGNVLQENPFFTPPSQFLQERRSRRQAEAQLA